MILAQLHGGCYKGHETPWHGQKLARPLRVLHLPSLCGKSMVEAEAALRVMQSLLTMAALGFPLSVFQGLLHWSPAVVGLAFLRHHLFM